MIEFKNFILNQGLSENTAKNYCLDVNEFLTICNVDISNLKEENIENWSIKIKEKQTDNKTINRKLASIKKFLNFLKETRNINLNLRKYFKNLKIREKILKIPTVKDIFSILEYIKNYRNESRTVLSLDLNNLKLDKHLVNDKLLHCENSPKNSKEWEDFRNYLIVKIIFVFGLRISEVCSLKMSDFITINNSKKIILNKKFIINGKGNKERMLPILDFVSNDILKLLMLYPKNIFDIEKEDFLNQKFFLKTGQKNSNITPFYVEKFLRKIKYELGISFDINPHIFRHACGTYLLENGINIREIQVLLGHSNLSTTQRYTKVSKKTLISGLEEVKF